MWAAYIQAHPEYKGKPIPDADFLHNNETDANRLVQLVLEGKKSASSSLYSGYIKYKVDLPKVGKKQIVTDFEGNALVIIETIQVTTAPFNQISADYAAQDMGTDKKALQQWKKAHWNFFESFLREMGEEPTEEMLIVCERFKTVWPEE